MEFLINHRTMVNLEQQVRQKRSSIGVRTGRLRIAAKIIPAVLLALAACGCGSSQKTQLVGALAGNWQFTMSGPADNSFAGGLGGGFLLQDNQTVTGGVTYSVSVPSQPVACNSGSAPVTGTMNDQGVQLTVQAGPQTFTLTGTLASDGSTMTGTYSVTAAQGCGTAQSGLAWSAKLVPSISGTLQGIFHSSPPATPPLVNQSFPVSGFLTQGPNIGASNATVTGTLTFDNYPCLTTASVNGQISGTNVILQIIASNGLNVGTIGAPVGSTNPAPVLFESAAGGTILHGTNGYGLTTTHCPGGNVPGDVGDICLGIGNTNACQQPLLISPAVITFPTQTLGTASPVQTITLTNNDPSGTSLTGLSLNFNPASGSTSPFGLSDFDGLPNFVEQDNCAQTPGSNFSLAHGQSCTVNITFTPQQSCPWLPSTSLGGVAPTRCPKPAAAMLTINSPVSADNNTQFAVPITGAGASLIVPSVAELDFGAEALSEKSVPQSITFTNQGASPVQILSALAPCQNGPTLPPLNLPRPITSGSVAGFQVVSQINANPGTQTISYNCDSDASSHQPNFQISADSCSGTVLAPQATCSIQIAFAPQPATSLVSGLDYFLELDTLECTSTTTADCEIDSGRFPIELTANAPSPLRMSPGAGLEFGTQSVGSTSTPLNVTLFNDPSDPNTGVVNFNGNLVKGGYVETDNCGNSLAPGSSCTLSVVFKPQASGFSPGTITIGYNNNQTQIVYLRGTGR